MGVTTDARHKQCIKTEDTPHSNTTYALAQKLLQVRGISQVHCDATPHQINEALINLNTRKIIFKISRPQREEHVAKGPDTPLLFRQETELVV